MVFRGESIAASIYHLHQNSASFGKKPQNPGPILLGKSFNLKLSGNEVDFTNAFLLPIKIMVCDKPHNQIFLIEIIFL